MTVYRLVHSGELPAVRFGRSYRIPESAVVGLVGLSDSDAQAG
jgi:excisionase family DNA binding protein